MSHDIPTEAGVVGPEMAPLDEAIRGIQTRGRELLPKSKREAVETADCLNRGKAA